MQEDKRLERLYDYTKWHIGIYLAIGGGLVASIGYLDIGPWYHLLKAPFLVVAFLAMVGAGIAGGIVGSSLASTATWEDFWEKEQGGWAFPLVMKGKTWTHVEHSCFWLSLILATVGVVSGEIAEISKFAHKTKTECQTHMSQRTTSVSHAVFQREN